MWHYVLDWINLAHGLIAAVAAIGFFKFWMRSGFWLPRYVHILAATMYLFGLLFTWLVLAAPRVSPNQGLPTFLVWTIVPLFFPAIVYFFFVFYGGQHIAFRNAKIEYMPCPYCRSDVGAVAGRRQFAPAVS